MDIANILEIFQESLDFKITRVDCNNRFVRQKNGLSVLGKYFKYVRTNVFVQDMASDKAGLSGSDGCTSDW